MRSLAACCIFALGAGCLNAQVVLSRRDYAERGRTWQQLWIVDRGTTDFRQLTHSARDHAAPQCSRDGRLIYFYSDRDEARSLNGYGAWHGRELWAFDLLTGQERVVRQTPDDDGLRLVGAADDGALLVGAGTELRSLSAVPWQIDKVDGSSGAAALSPDGRTLAVVLAKSFDGQGRSVDAELFLVDTATGQSRTPLGKYEAPTWSPDGKQIAVFGEGGLAIIDVATQKQVAHAAWPKPDRPPQDLVWSPDQKSVLVGLYSEDAGSGDPQSDYFIFNISAGTWTPSLTARQLVWLDAGKTLLYLRPYATTPLTPGSKHEVWTSQLAEYDLTTHKDSQLTTGLVLNDFMSACGRAKP